MSLQGKKIVITRAAHQADELADMLLEAGAEPLLFPCIGVEPPKNPSILNNALRTIDRFDWLILTSSNTVIALEKHLSKLGKNSEIFDDLRVAAVGDQTAQAAIDLLGIRIDILPEQQNAEGLGAVLPDMTDAKVFLPQSAIAQDTMRDVLRNAGADVVAVDAYQTIPSSTGGVSVQDVRNADAVTFTSPSTVQGFAARCGGAVELPAVCIGPTTGDEALKAGFIRVHQPDADYSLRGLLTVLQDIFEKIAND